MSLVDGASFIALEVPSIVRPGRRIYGARVGRAVIAILAATAAISTSTRPSVAEDPHVKVSLVADTRSVSPGQSLHLALRLQIEPGWHTYWLNPGDSGLPTTIDWTLPPDFKAGPIVWPTPERFAYGPVVDYGYRNEIVLPATIDVPSNLTPGTSISLAARASWLVCSDTCIPEEAQLSIALLVSAVAEADPDGTKLIASARARTPMPNPFRTTVAAADGNITLRVATGDATRLTDVMFFPADAGVVDNDAQQSVTAEPDGLTLTLLRDTAKPAPAMLNGVLVFRDSAAQAADEPQAITISAPVGRAPMIGGVEFVWAILLAAAGGLLLNLMPCVLPVLAIKAFGLVQHAQSAPREPRLQGIAYAAGVMISFAVVALALIGLRAAGAEIGWGFQLQSPLFVTVMIYILFAVGLNLSGVFTFGDRLAGIGNGLAAREGYSGSFLTGALATLVASPCTAPFMAAAMGYAITQPWYLSLAVFEAVGLGMAFPYLAIAFSPAARRFLPRGGAWMLQLKQFLAFPLYGTAVWLFFVLSQEAGDLAATAVLAGLVLIAFAAWLYEAARQGEGRSRNGGIGLSALSVIAAFGLLDLTQTNRPSATAEIKEEAGLPWQPFSQDRLSQLQAEGRPIFVDVGAAWCITCKINERIALADPVVLKAFADAGVAALRGDWTRQDAAITRVLEANGRAGVPLYLFYPRSGKSGDTRSPVILPQILTAETVLREIRGN
jgi:thiol:disulfide interchange protein DsbD